MVLADLAFPHTGRLIAVQGDITRYSADRDRRTPIPPKMACALRMWGHTPHALRAAGHVLALLLLPQELKRREEHDAHLVFPFTQILLHGKVIPQVHILSPACKNAVYKHFAQRIEHLAVEKHLVHLQQGLVHEKGAAVFPIPFRHPFAFFLILPDKGIGDFAERQQVAIVAARRFGGHPLPLPRLTELPDAPCAV